MPETSIPLGGIHLKLLRLSLETRILEELDALALLETLELLEKLDSLESLENLDPLDLLENQAQRTIVICQDCMFKRYFRWL